MFRRQIPNILTLCNLLSGCASVYFVSSGNFRWAAIMVLIAAVFDLFDGMVARLLGVAGPMGVQLDSLADVVSFGVAPSFMAFEMIRMQGQVAEWVAFLSMLMAAASAFRLAKFNIDNEQKNLFKGIPTPANAIFWSSLAMYGYNSGNWINSYFLLVLAMIMSFLLVCNLKMFAFKSRDWSWKVQKYVYFFLIAVILLVIFFGYLGLAVSVVLYPLFSWLHFTHRKKIDMEIKC